MSAKNGFLVSVPDCRIIKIRDADLVQANNEWKKACRHTDTASEGDLVNLRRILAKIAGYDDLGMINLSWIRSRIRELGKGGFLKKGCTKKPRLGNRGNRVFSFTFNIKNIIALCEIWRKSTPNEAAPTDREVMKLQTYVEKSAGCNSKEMFSLIWLRNQSEGLRKEETMKPEKKHARSIIKKCLTASRR